MAIPQYFLLLSAEATLPTKKRLTCMIGTGCFDKIANRSFGIADEYIDKLRDVKRLSKADWLDAIRWYLIHEYEQMPITARAFLFHGIVHCGRTYLHTC